MKSSCKINIVDDDNQTPSIHPPFLPQDILSSLIPTYLEDAPHSKNRNRIYSNRITQRTGLLRSLPLLFLRKRKRKKEEKSQLQCSQSTAACRNLTGEIIGEET